jgi:phosphate transport system substrate-binding protein
MRKIRNLSSGLKRLPIALGVVGGVAALAIGLAGPANADPGTSFVAVGSDTVQDVENQFATDFGNGAIGSWDAVNPATPTATHDEINPKPGCSMSRPNGSGEGVNALRKSINPATTAAQLADPPEPGCVDIARSSSAPGANQSNTGALVYIPFALDAVATATGPATAVGGAKATNIKNADSFSVGTLTAPGDLIKLYRDCATVTVGTTVYNPNTAAAGQQQINLYVPQAGSGTRSFWATTLGFNPTTLPACVHDHSVVDGSAVEEHDGTVYANDPNGFGPFSIAQFIAQGNGHNDRRHNAAIHSLEKTPSTAAIAPEVGGALNTAYPVTREVYNVVQDSRVTPGNPAFSQQLSNLLVGPNSSVCQDSFTLTDFGFASLDSAPLGHTCGQVANDLRAFDPTANPV